jgi:hypothetical protein
MSMGANSISGNGQQVRVIRTAVPTAAPAVERIGKNNNFAVSQFLPGGQGHIRNVQAILGVNPIVPGIDEGVPEAIIPKEGMGAGEEDYFVGKFYEYLNKFKGSENLDEEVAQEKTKLLGDRQENDKSLPRDVQVALNALNSAVARIKLDRIPHIEDDVNLGDIA